MLKRVSFVLVIIIFLFVNPQTGMAEATVGPADRLTISNFRSGDTIAYDLPLLKGTAPGSTSVTVQGNGISHEVAVNDGRWRAFVLLKPGSNLITLTTAEGYQFNFTLNYTPSTNPLMVRMVYVMGADSTGVFDAPVGAPNTKENAIKRLRTAARMLQSMTAELLYEKGLPRRTFRLQTDASGEPVVDVTVVPRTTAQLRAMDGMDLWYYFYDAFSNITNRNNIKDITIIADTHYNPSTQTLQAHTALGGGRLALFGSATLYSWPETIQGIENHFIDATPIPSEVFPEYARTNAFWATYTTSIGAVLHEFGHCVGLDHPQNPQPGDIMQRGFDFLNRLAVTYEPGYGSIDPASTIMPNWTGADANTLQSNPWIANAALGNGSGGPVLVPGKLSTTPTGLTLYALKSQPGSISREVKVNVSWLDIGWTAQVNGSLPVTIDKTQGNSGENITITVNSTGYDLGQYEGSITITATDSTIQNSPLVVPIKLVVVNEVNLIYTPLILR